MLREGHLPDYLDWVIRHRRTIKQSPEKAPEIIKNILKDLLLSQLIYEEDGTPIRVGLDDWDGPLVRRY